MPVCYAAMPALSAADALDARIFAAVRAIPRGSWASYGEVARRVGLPRGARRVARALAGNDDPALPWHRVLRSGGIIAFPTGSDGYARQCALLLAEGVSLRGGRVLGAGGAASLDAALWAPPD
jgi:methylated-DNA-protein-cysteine methyltransferase-like protein